MNENQVCKNCHWWQSTGDEDTGNCLSLKVKPKGKGTPSDGVATSNGLLYTGAEFGCVNHQPKMERGKPAV